MCDPRGSAPKQAPAPRKGVHFPALILRRRRVQSLSSSVFGIPNLLVSKRSQARLAKVRCGSGRGPASPITTNSRAVGAAFTVALSPPAALSHSPSSCGSPPDYSSVAGSTWSAPSGVGASKVSATSWSFSTASSENMPTRPAKAAKPKGLACSTVAVGEKNPPRMTK